MTFFSSFHAFMSNALNAVFTGLFVVIIAIFAHWAWIFFTHLEEELLIIIFHLFLDHLADSAGVIIKFWTILVASGITSFLGFFLTFFALFAHFLVSISAITTSGNTSGLNFSEEFGTITLWSNSSTSFGFTISSMTF